MRNSLALPEGWSVFDDTTVVAEAAVHKIIELANQSISQKGEFHFVTAGGSTPKLVYKMMMRLETEQPEITDWKKWYIYMGDERVLPSEDEERNSKTLMDCWLAKSRIPKSHHFLMPTEMGLQASADAYRKVISCAEFDLVMLGMGEDGHTASLFPDHSSVSLGGVVCETNSPKPPSQRLSISYERLNSAKYVLKLITGASKQPAIKEWLSGSDLPITRIQGITKELVYLDRAAIP